MIYIDSEDPYFNRVVPNQPTKKEDSIITNKILVIFGIVAICKVAVLLLLW